MTQVPTVTEPVDLVWKLDTIGLLKGGLPFYLRGWANIAGLYIQRRHGVDRLRVAAGGKFISYFEGVSRTPVPVADSDWDIRRFDEGTWQRRFAHLVWPTWDIVLFVSGGDLTKPTGSQFDESTVGRLEQVVGHFKMTGEWLGLLHRKCAGCARKVRLWEGQGESCPFCGDNLTKAQWIRRW